MESNSLPPLTISEITLLTTFSLHATKQSVRDSARHFRKQRSERVEKREKRRAEEHRKNAEMIMEKIYSQAKAKVITKGHS